MNSLITITTYIINRHEATDPDQYKIKLQNKPGLRFDLKNRATYRNIISRVKEDVSERVIQQNSLVVLNVLLKI